MKSKEQIIAEMQHDPYWKIPDEDKLGFYKNEIVEKQTKKFVGEVDRRMKIQSSRETREFNERTNQLDFVVDFLYSKRKEYEKHYQEDIHGSEN